jgi:hypothetical protein
MTCELGFSAVSHSPLIQEHSVIYPIQRVATLIRGYRSSSLSPAIECVLLFALLVGASSPVRAETFDIVVKETDMPSNTVWRIETPNVKQGQTDYRQITFLPSDQVSVHAGGCVQTGGLGLTWKRYVDPSGPDADRLYHGLIRIPGITKGFVRLKDFGLEDVKSLPKDVPASVRDEGLFLRLGYEDGQYDDNGYESHDDGTGDQCKDGEKAFVVVSIGHGGAAPLVAIDFDGITPSRFRCQGAWAFRNFGTERLGWDTFKNAFDFQWYDYLDPATYIVYLATRDSLAAGGNCMGMSLLADVAEDQFLVDDLQENLWSNYKNENAASPRIVQDINTAHWAQLSVTFLHDYIANVVKSPADNARLIESDLAKKDFNYGLISIAKGTKGHVLVPLRVRRSGESFLVDVYDSNRPCTASPDTTVYPPIVINGSSWSYVMQSGETWSGSTANDGLAYVPYKGSSGWRRFGANFAGVVQVLFGANAKVDQVSDSQGRKLFIAGTQRIDPASTGLGKAVIRLPLHQQSADRRPRSGDPRFTTSNPVQETAAARSAAARFESEYAADYAHSSTVFLVDATQLADLEFQVSAINGARPVRALVRQDRQFFETRVVGSAGAAANFGLAIHHPSTLAADGVSVRSLGAKPVSSTFTAGQVTDGGVRIQRTLPLSTIAGSRIKLLPAGVQVTSRSKAGATTISDESIDASGRAAVTRRALGVARETGHL